MKRTAAIIFCWVIAVGLILYGPLGMAAAQESGASFTMEICADGVSETVVINSYGIPVEPSPSSHDCHDCLVCSHAMEVSLHLGSAKIHFDDLVDAASDQASFDILYTRTKNIRPKPRGPPMGHIATVTMSGLIYDDQAYDGQQAHGDGRPVLKDASA